VVHLVAVGTFLSLIRISASASSLCSRSIGSSLTPLRTLFLASITSVRSIHQNFVLIGHNSKTIALPFFLHDKRENFVDAR